MHTLSDWAQNWTQRPTCVVSVAPGGLPALVQSVAEHLAAAGRLPYANWPVERVPSDLPSADEAAALKERLGAGPQAPVSEHTVLLVIDRTSSGWAATVAAAVLRGQGAKRVLPLVVHRTAG